MYEQLERFGTTYFSLQITLTEIQNFTNNFFQVSDSLQVRSISVLNIEADEFDFYSESNKSITFSASQVKEYI